MQKLCYFLLCVLVPIPPESLLVLGEHRLLKMKVKPLENKTGEVAGYMSVPQDCAG